MAAKANEDVKNIGSKLTAQMPTVSKPLIGIHKPSPSKTSGIHKPSPSKTSGIHKPSPSKTSGIHKPSPSKTSGIHESSPSKTSGRHEPSPSRLSGVLPLIGVHPVPSKIDEDAAKIYKPQREQCSYKNEDVAKIHQPDIEKPSGKRSLESDINILLKHKCKHKRTYLEKPSHKRNLKSEFLKSGFKDEDPAYIDLTCDDVIDLTCDDDVVLDPFLCARSLEDIRTLIESGKLPSQKILDEMCQIYNRQSKKVIITCQAICEHIKSKHDAIEHVWAAYTIQNLHRITFVVIVKIKSEGDTRTKSLCLDKLITYSFINQYVGEFSSEGTEVLRHQTSASVGLDEKSYQKLQSCISKHSEVLMKKHKFLSIISACPNRSKGFGASWKLLPEKCIVLYVQKKNYIPIDEEPFETKYDGIPVDVREGAFTPFGRTAKELLDPVQMGSQIGGDIYAGTLGFFIDHPQFGICGLTCAHVLLKRWEMTQLKTLHGGTLKWPLHEMSKNVYQPADKQSVLGHTVQVIYKEGSDENCGMELALFRITDRHPKSPSFPYETGSNVATSIKYDSWRMCSTHRLNKKDDAHVIKFGSKTELSHGIIKFDTISVKTLEACIGHENVSIKLLKQIEVKAQSNGIPFAKNGDSGAPVFVVEENSQNKCIGIVEGGTSYGTVVVTPIVPILAELDVPCLKSFDTEKELSNIQNKINTLKTHVQTFGSDVRGINSNMQTIHHEIKNIFNRSLQVNNNALKKVNGDMQMITHLLLNLSQKFNSSSANSQNDQHGGD
ncbi:uncharacterized protein LOC132757952 [Ruditapes philippinarum]|uniref:uncharacterized protein LOC132757952 n=1 Tax=Ruditapes philippinarum TaxID=129788 RepID=UPI00295BA278|nr:uncharacterized protein LOC132757952 [Ruditapes philippinarum]